MTSANARKGAQYETDLLSYLRSSGMLAERLPKSGREDECDLVIAGSVYTRGVRFEIIEAKNRAKLDLPQFLRERDAGVENYAKHRNVAVEEVGGIVVIKRRNHRIGKSFVVTTLDDYYGVNRILEWD